MNLPPLIPVCEDASIPDISPVIREIFQEILSKPMFPKNVAINADKCNVQVQHLKLSAGRVLKVYNDIKLTLEDIGVVEKQIMVEQAKLLAHQDEIENNYPLKEYIKLKQELDVESKTNKDEPFQLLHKRDLLPSPPRRSIDFKINFNPHRCKHPSTTELDIVHSKSKRKRFHFNPNKRKYKIRQPHKKPIKIFEIEPPVVLFQDYIINTVYEKYFKMRNVTKSIQSFVPGLLSKGSYFMVDLIEGSTRVAPGMFVLFSVKYKTNIYRDVEEELSFSTFSGLDVTVLLKSKRSPPELTIFIFKGIDHFLTKQGYQKLLYNCCESKRLALNSTIDCGSCLIGDELILNLIIRNQGSDGIFFILSEAEWYSSKISITSSKTPHKLGSFYINPVYFEILNDQFVEMEIVYRPRQFGLSVEKLFFMCNNNTYEELEIIGDGLYLDSTSIFIDPSHIKPINMGLDVNTSHYLFFNACLSLPKQQYVKSITVQNNSPLDLLYKWKVCSSQCYLELSELKKMNSEWISMCCNEICLESHSTTEFPVTLNLHSVPPATYSIVANLYILDMPKSCIKEHTVFIKKERPEHPDNDEDRFDVIIGSIEILARVTELIVEIMPENIISPQVLMVGEYIKQDIRISTSSPINLTCAWRATNMNYFEIYPVHFILKEDKTVTCTIKITASSYNDIKEDLILVINEGLVEKNVKVSVKVIKPSARFSTSLLHFGFVPKYKEVPSKSFFVINTGLDKISWKIFQFYYNYDQKAIYEIQDSKNLSCTEGELEAGESYEVSYTIQETNLESTWLSFLTLCTKHPPTIKALGSLCLVTFEVTKPNVLIHSNSSKQSVIFPGHLLYLNCISYHGLCVHNVDSKLTASFIWGSPFGEDANKIKIRYKPKFGIIKPQSCVHVTFSLQPLDTGLLEKIQIPCFIGNTDEPIMISVLCIVDDICVYFHLPNLEGGFQKIFWPPKATQESETFSVDLGHEAEEVEYIMGEEHYTEQKDASHDISSEQIEEINEANAEELVNSELKFELLEETEEKPEKYESSSTISSSDRLHSIFGSTAFLHDFILDYINIPLRTPVRKTIIIDNVTPIIGTYKISTVNFFVKEYEFDKQQILNKMLDKVKLKKLDEWENVVNSNYGVAVQTTPNYGKLGYQQSVEIDIWVYANTWGTYIEEVVVEINDILPFTFNLLLDIVGCPIEFPFALNTIYKEPIMRFGNIPYLAKPVKRVLKLRNFSCVPVCLVWHVFLTNLPQKKKQPFNVVLDNVKPNENDTDTDSTTKLLITPRYYGKEDCFNFQIDPRVIRINGNSIASIVVSLHSRYFRLKNKNTNVEANLVGHIHLSEDYRFVQNVYYRPSDLHLAPAKMKLTANLNLPILELELLKGDQKISVYANDVLEANKIKFKKMFTFRNNSLTPITVYMHTMAPFRVVSLVTAQLKSENKFKTALVCPGHVVEVSVECVIHSETVMMDSHMLFNLKETRFYEVPDFMNNSISIRRNLNIHQDGITKQILPLELVVFYSKINVSPEFIDFGIVSVGNCKKMLITLTNTTAAPLPFNVQNITPANTLTIIPTEGVIPKASGLAPSTLTLRIFFVPREAETYQETIAIVSNIPLNNKRVNLVGMGSLNEKFYNEAL